ncbi:unnamed protein product [Clavelina lepadiformis]|uniref:Fucosyltransferase n=1 Tax=Clavelina lepadiformis TaxID=159417 RepID=A0ABP0F471_CLALP
MTRLKRWLFQLSVAFLTLVLVLCISHNRGLIATYQKHQDNTVEQPGNTYGTYQLSKVEVPSETAKTTMEKAPKPKILMWVPPYHDGGWTLPDSEACGFGCEITKDRNQYESSDALIFYMKGTNGKDLPDSRKRRPDQAFVWWSHESPWTVNHYWHKTLTEFNGYFNWTMHYRSDSNITAAMMPYSARDWYFNRVGRKAEMSVKELKPNTTEEGFDKMFDELMKLKTRSTAWIVSDCNDVKGAPQRRQFADSMKNDGKFNIDVYGKCGNKQLAKTSSAMYDTLRTYKFYLAFENTKFCKEYLTEKFWYNSLYAGVVPVVWGPSKKTVESLAPPNSFIHAEDFEYDAKKLVDFLRSLEGDEKAYKEYFKWWMMPGFFPVYKLKEAEDPRDRVSESICHFEVNGFCHLCKMLHEKKHKTTHWSVPDLRQAYYGAEDPKCVE